MSPALRSELARAVASPPVLLATDFDGVLSEIVDHPADARPHPAAKSALIALAADPRFEVAVVSGRALVDLRDRLGGHDGITTVGEHGNDWGDSEVVVEPSIASLARDLEALTLRFPGTEIEVKPSSVAFHYRNAVLSRAEKSVEAALEHSAAAGGFRVLHGKAVIELTLATSTKADAVARLREGSKSVIYLGDDVTDEHVFASMGENDISIKVGPGDTLARHRLGGVEEVASLLIELCGIAGVEAPQV